MQFHVLHNVVGSEAETDFEPVGERTHGEAPRCPICGTWVGLMPSFPPHVGLLRGYGSRLGDVISDTGDDLLVSEPFLVAWRAAGLHGLDHVDLVEVVGVRPKRLGRDLPSYYHTTVRRTGVRVDRSRSLILGTPPFCELCGPEGTDAVLVLRLDEATWAGEDIFIPWGAHRIIVTQRVVDLAREHSLANLNTTPIEVYQYDSRYRSEGAAQW